MILRSDIPVILASASPRRKEILEAMGLEFTCLPAHLDEDLQAGETPVGHVMRLAVEKGAQIAERYPEALVISADTIVLYRGQILGKPRDREDAFRILNTLSGRTHEVITAFALTNRSRSLHTCEYESTAVTFRELSPEAISAYIDSESPMDKAGAYGIQDLQANFVRKIDGCFYNVTGFPAAAFLEKWDRTLSALK